MTEVLEILKYILPSLVVFLTTFYLVRKYFESENKKLLHKQILNNQNMITPLRLQAYERMILFLERISIESLTMRTNKAGYSCQQLQTEMTNAVRSEFEHNLAQQIYISTTAWEMLKAAKVQTIQLINLTAGKLEKEASAVNLSKALLDTVVDNEKEITAGAVKLIKKEISQLF